MILCDSNLCSFDVELLYHGSVCLNADWHSDNAKNYYTRLYFVRSGNGYLRDAKGTVPLRGGNVYLMPSEHAFGFGCEQLDKIFFHILLPFEEKIDLLSETKRLLVLENCGEWIETLYELYGQNDPASFLQIKQMIYQVLVHFITEHRISFPSKRTLSEMTRSTLSFVRTHTTLKLTVDEIARRLYVSPSTLRNTFKAEIGIPIGQYIDDMLFLAVQKSITQGIAIEEIAARFGFCDRHYLSRRFKEKCGKTITEYRREMMM